MDKFLPVNGPPARPPGGGAHGTLHKYALNNSRSQGLFQKRQPLLAPYWRDSRLSMVVVDTRNKLKVPSPHRLRPCLALSCPAMLESRPNERPITTPLGTVRQVRKCVLDPSKSCTASATSKPALDFFPNSDLETQNLVCFSTYRLVYQNASKSTDLFFCKRIYLFSRCRRERNPLLMSRLPTVPELTKAPRT